jgi:hypothetical protein
VPLRSRPILSDRNREAERSHAGILFFQLALPFMVTFVAAIEHFPHRAAMMRKVSALNCTFLWHEVHSDGGAE